MRLLWRKWKVTGADGLTPGREGSTMAELIVAFALLGIFLAVAAMVTGIYFRTFTRTREYGSQRILASTLLDAIEYELGAAVKNAGYESADLTPGSGSVSYLDSDGTPSRLTVDENGYLRIARGADAAPEEALDSEASALFPEPVLLYGSLVYGRSRIAGLSFGPLERAAEKHLVKVTLSLESGQFSGMTCETSRVVYCYNLEEL